MLIVLFAAVVCKLQSSLSSEEYLEHARIKLEEQLKNALDKNQNVLQTDLIDIFAYETYESIEGLQHYLNSELRFQYYASNELILWNDSQLPDVLPILNKTELLVDFEGRQYIVQQFEKENKRLLIYTPLLWKESLLRDLHDGEFLIDGELNEDIDVVDAPQSHDILYNGNFLFGLRLSRTAEIYNKGAYDRTAATLFLLAYFISMLWVLISFVGRQVLRNPLLILLSFLSVFVLWRFFMSEAKDLFSLNSLGLFDAEVFASGVLGIESMGDLILHFSLPLFVMGFVFTNRRVYSLVYSGLEERFGVGLLWFIELVFLNLFFFVSAYLVRLFVRDASISLEGLFLIYRAGSQTIFIYILVTFLVVLSALLLYNFSDKTNLVRRRVLWFGSQLALFLICWLFRNYQGSEFVLMISTLMLIVAVGIFLYFEIKTSSGKAQLYLVSVLLFSVSLAYVFYDSVNKKKLDYAKTIAREFLKPTDPLADFLIDDLIKQVKNDALLSRTFSSLFISDKAIRERIRRKYFDRYLERYELSLFEYKKFKSTGTEEIQRTEEKVVFHELGKLGYLLRIPIKKEDETTDTLVLSLVQSSFRTEEDLSHLGFDFVLPESRTLSDFSAATYKEDVLIRQYGPYPYTISRWLNVFGTEISEEFRIVREGEYRHVLYYPGDDYLQVVTVLTGGIFGLLAQCSGFFLLSLLSVSLFWLFFGLTRRKDSGNGAFNFQSRIELSLIGLVLFVFLVIGVVTIVYTQSKYKSNLVAEAVSQSRTLAEQFESLLGDNGFKGISEETSLELNATATGNQQYYRLFGNQGEILDHNLQNALLSRLNPGYMDHVAFWELKIMEKSFFHQYEDIRGTSFISVYLPISNNSKAPQAYLNVPFYNTQSRLNAQTSSFLGSLINIFGVLIILSALLLFGLANMLTAPLRLMLKVIEETKAGKRDIIQQTSADEIGAMLEEYNSMVKELDEKAELLAQSEKDAAWRQMARQVAHEIKNPLTPVKLSMQHLLRSWKDKSPDFEKKLNRISATVMQQIESLNNIASEFSDFAQMPLGTPEKTDISLVLSEVVRLYKDQVRITLLDETFEDRSWIMADKEQMSRVFNNLVKNASQSRPDSEKVEILIQLRRLEDDYVIDVKDNGKGIPEDLFDKIFVPNFTTKNSGMGLGLAIVKKIVEQSGGNISFESFEKRGTTFTVILPVHFPVE